MHSKSSSITHKQAQAQAQAQAPTSSIIKITYKRHMNMKTPKASDRTTAILRAAKAIDAARISLRAAAHANDDLLTPHQGAKRASDPNHMLARLVSLEHRNGDRGSQPKNSDRQFEQSYVAFNPNPSRTLETAQGESHGDGRAESAQCFGGKAPRKSSDHKEAQAA